MTGDDFSDDPELRELFAQDTAQRLRRMTETTLALEVTPGDADALAQLFRDAHSIKGSAPVVGMDDIASLAHVLEDLLGAARAGERLLTPADCDAILAATDALGRMATRGLAGEDTAAEGAAAEAALRAHMDGVAPAGTQLAPVGTDAATTPVPADAPPTSISTDAAPAPVTTGAPPAPGPVETPPAPVTPPAPAAAPLEADELVTVPRARLDRLVNLAGEAVTARLRLHDLLAATIAEDTDAETASLTLDRTLTSIQTEVLGARMTTLAPLVATLRRAVRDVARSGGKTAELQVGGEHVELDRGVIDQLHDPLLHLVRNAVDHGLEKPSGRRAAGKPTRGVVTLAARRRGGEVVITVADDGAGLDLDALREKAGRPGLDDAAAAELIFQAGLSTAQSVSDVSGRGVGMDAVRTSIEALRGSVTVSTVAGQGTTFTLVAPVTLAIQRCVIVDAAGERYALPAHATSTIVDDPRAAEVGLEGGAALWVGGDIVPLAHLADVLDAPEANGGGTGPAIVIRSSAGGERCALRVDGVDGQRDVTAKEIAVVPRSALVAGASIEPNGAVILVLDPAALVARAVGRGRPPVVLATAAPAAAEVARASILVVDDALTVRELQRSILARAGYTVATAVDGRDALDQLRLAQPDLVITDVDMPRMDGMELTRTIRADADLSSLPVLMVTSHGTDADRQAGLDAGADAYIVKQDFDAAQLLQAVTALLGGGA